MSLTETHPGDEYSVQLASRPKSISFDVDFLSRTHTHIRVHMYYVRTVSAGFNESVGTKPIIR